MPTRSTLAGLLCTVLLLPAAAAASPANTLSVAYATRDDPTSTTYTQVTQELVMRHAVVGTWMGAGQAWVLMFTDGTGTDACKEVVQPTGATVLTLMLPGPPPDASAEPSSVTLEEATFIVGGRTAGMPLMELETRQLRFTAAEGDPVARHLGELEIQGTYGGLNYKIAGSFSAQRCP